MKDLIKQIYIQIYVNMYLGLLGILANTISGVKHLGVSMPRSVGSIHSPFEKKVKWNILFWATASCVYYPVRRLVLE